MTSASRLERTNVLPQLVVLFLKGHDLVVHVSLGLVRGESFFRQQTIDYCSAVVGSF